MRGTPEREDSAEWGTRYRDATLPHDRRRAPVTFPPPARPHPLARALTATAAPPRPLPRPRCPAPVARDDGTAPSRPAVPRTPRGSRSAAGSMWRRLRSALRSLRGYPAAPPHGGGRGPPAAMERAVVRCVPSEPKLSLRFVLPDGSARHMQRDQAEPLGRALARIATNAAKGHGKAGKKSKKARAEGGAEGEVTVPAVRLFSRDGAAVPEEVPNAAAWQDGAVLYIGDAQYRVERNPPALIELSLPRSLLAGFPVCPKVSTEFAAPQHCVFRWFREQRPADGGDAAGEAWVETAAAERVFTPSNALVGLRLKLRCTPGDGEQRYGPAREVESSGPVEAGPGACTFDTRHLYTKKVCGHGSVRAVSYNILADTYAQTEFSRTVLYPYCAPYALEIDYRQNLLKKELAGYSADLICLQEVDKSVFVDSLAPALDAFGLEGLFRIKEKQHEGLATFYRRDKFSLLSQHDIAFSEALLSEPLHKELCEQLAKYPLVQEKVLQRSSVLQVPALTCHLLFPLFFSFSRPPTVSRYSRASVVER